MERVVITEGPEETMRLGEELAGELKEGDVVALVGELGTGKTTKGSPWGCSCGSR